MVQLAIAGWFVSPVMSKIIDKGYEYLENQGRWQTGMKEEQQWLREIHPKIQAIIDLAASQPQIGDQNPALNKWLWLLRDAIDAAEDALDQFEYLKHKEQLARNKEEAKEKPNILSEIAETICNVWERALQNDPNLIMLEEALSNLVDVSAEVSAFLHLLEMTTQKQQEQQLELYRTRETGSFPTNDLIGRGKDMEVVMQWLRKPSEAHQKTLYSKISLLSIVGHGGMGKTTLMQHVYEDTRENEFDLKMWVCVSNNFETKRVIADMLESLKTNRYSLEASDRIISPPLESLDALQRSLKSEVMGRKFLLVLDDIWEEQEDRDIRKWENVLAPLDSGSLGSKILVTTRMDSAALMIAKVIKKKKETLRLEGLEMDECLQLLNSHAFADVENPDDHKKLGFIAREIVKKLSGSPLAAKVIGGVLNFDLDEKHWSNVLNSDFGGAQPIQNDIFYILRLSYTFLPTSLKNCFAFCCMFPQDHKFDKKDLVRMWIALDFIQPPSNLGENLEDIGGRYFDILVKKSFFDKFKNWYKTYYKMHDLLHELAKFVSLQECLRVVDDEELSNPETVRHLSVQTTKIEVLRKLTNFKNLRSLFLTYDLYENQEFVGALSEILKASRTIRLLFIKASQRIPEEIGNLTHLRYLKIDNGKKGIQLPRSISNLYHLHYIIYLLYYRSYDFSILDDFLPRDMNNLFNLRCLELPCKTLPEIQGIGKLHFLTKLNGFFIKNEAGHRIDELKHMNELRQLSIYQLENVKDAEEACSAKFSDKRNLTDLLLQWGDDKGDRNTVRLDLDEKVLDNLKPHNNLKQLTIKAYMGTRSAIWMDNADFISNLECVKLDGCLEWQNLPPFGALPFLKSLYLRNMPKPKSLDYKSHKVNKDCAFPRLELLHIEKLEALEDWFDVAAGVTKDCLFPCLTELCLKDCSNLRMLPSLPPKLQELELVDIKWEAFSWLQDTSNCCMMKIHNNDNFTYKREPIDKLTYSRQRRGLEPTKNNLLMRNVLHISDLSVLLMELLRSITSLQSLHIERNNELISFPIEAEQWFLQVSPSLCRLSFSGLQSLVSLPSFLESPSSLEFLMVFDVPQLRLLPNLPDSLKELHLEELKSLQCLPSNLSAISSLKSLRLRNIPILKSLPDFPATLDHVSLIGLENLDCLPCYFPSLSSLKSVYISDISQLRLLPNLPDSLKELHLEDLKSLQCLPSNLSVISSLKSLRLRNIPILKSLPDLPATLHHVSLIGLENLDCLPSNLSAISSLKFLTLRNIPILKSLPDLPVTLNDLSLTGLENLDCLPCNFPSLSSLKSLYISDISQLLELPDLPLSLYNLCLKQLDNLNCMPSCLPRLTSLKYLEIDGVPQLRELPDLPSSLKTLSIINCHPELKERYKKNSGSDWHKIAHIASVVII